MSHIVLETRRRLKEGDICNRPTGTSSLSRDSKNRQGERKDNMKRKYIPDDCQILSVEIGRSRKFTKFHTVLTTLRMESIFVHCFEIPAVLFF